MHPICVPAGRPRSNGATSWLKSWMNTPSDRKAERKASRRWRFARSAKNSWRLDTGTSPTGLSGKPEQYHHPDRKMFPDHIKNEPLFHFPEVYSLHRGQDQYCSHPVLHYNGTRLILLTGQITKDGRRLMYVWKSAEQKTPKRFALRFSGFEWMEDLNEEEKADWNLIARNSILSIFEWRDRLVFEYPRGFFHLRIEEFEGYLNR
jgi:hypothetical protein